MSLNWNISAIDNYEELIEPEMDSITSSLIYATIFVGMNKITESNAKDFFARIAYYEKLLGTLMISVDDNNEIVPRPIKYSDVVRHIGLHTNAENFSDTKFKNKMFNSFRDSIADEVKV